MAMREGCRHYESRTYANGETVRKCNLDLAPDAPWRCPDPCPGFAVRLDAGWTYGSMVTSNVPADPPGLDDGSAAAVLDEAEEIVNAIGATVMAEVRMAEVRMAEVQAERLAVAPRRSGWRRWLRRG